MGQAGYRLDWSRPATQDAAGERRYHATDGSHHILVVLTTTQLVAAEALARAARADEPETSVQAVIEDAIGQAVADGRLHGGELRLEDRDFVRAAD